MRELSLNILDIVQNSIRANANLIEIKITHSAKEQKLTIAVNDNGCGMTPAQLEQVIDPFYTSRTTRNVGLGVPLFKMAAEQTGGRFSINSVLGQGTKLFAEFITSHLDMTPLGDINSTVAILIRCNPQTDFLYTCTTDNGEFVLDTKELRTVLGDDVALDTPEVMEWIEGYIAEGTAEFEAI
jgi:anti-sigma regulatory factor (Ser/Thr protein kinase)